jgi:tRNA1Val (adenine37-N6)-methyltransferase
MGEESERIIPGRSGAPKRQAAPPSPAALPRIEIRRWGIGLRVPDEGFPVSQESLLLLETLAGQPWRRAFDLGCGSGLIACVLAAQNPEGRVDAAELAPEAAAVARWNARENGLSQRVRVHEIDIAAVPERFPRGQWDLVVSNPPYRRPGAGRISRRPSRALATAELRTDLHQVIRAAEHLLSLRGLLALVVACERLPETLRLLHALSLSPSTLRFIHHTPEYEASAVVILAARGRPDLVVSPPLFARLPKEPMPSKE